LDKQPQQKKTHLSAQDAYGTKSCARRFGNNSSGLGAGEDTSIAGGSSMKKSLIQSLIVLTLIFIASAEARAIVQILPPNQIVAGQTQLFWAQAWWQWVLGVPCESSTTCTHNPNIDPTGAFAGTNNDGPVFFLAGNFGGTSSRTIAVPFGKPVFFPVVNRFFAAVGAHGNYDPSPCPNPLTLGCALDQVTPQINQATNLTVTIDSITITSPTITSFRQTSTSFFVVCLPKDNIFAVLFGIPLHAHCYFGHHPVWVQDGYYITLSNLSSGKHNLHFHGELPGGFVLDVTDTLNVVAP
jgi:hypothetical protein